MIRILSDDIPAPVVKNIGHYCGFFDPNVFQKEWQCRRTALLADHNCSRIMTVDSVFYEFESEAHYSWFLLKWSYV